MENISEVVLSHAAYRDTTPSSAASSCLQMGLGFPDNIEWGRAIRNCSISVARCSGKRCFFHRIINKNERKEGRTKVLWSEEPGGKEDKIWLLFSKPQQCFNQTKILPGDWPRFDWTFNLWISNQRESKRWISFIFDSQCGQHLKS